MVGGDTVAVSGPLRMVLCITASPSENDNENEPVSLLTTSACSADTRLPTLASASSPHRPEGERHVEFVGSVPH